MFMLENIIVLFGFVIALGCMFFIDFTRFKHRGHATG